jgi:hypothetical protein
MNDAEIGGYRHPPLFHLVPQSSGSNRIVEHLHRGIAGVAQQRRQRQLRKLRQSAKTAMPKSALPMR